VNGVRGVKTRCCRSTPRCAGCPVLLIAARRRQAGMPDLFAEILGGRSTRTLPESPGLQHPERGEDERPLEQTRRPRNCVVEHRP